MTGFSLFLIFHSSALTIWHHLVSIDTSLRFACNQRATPWKIGTAWRALYSIQRLLVS
ncbi:hypothetical protein LY78DRAFT_352833 [Colletotrichum sublineola]|nr:hypothetical protein LY78DRAFT_352833 [Colletotrichum sublineola]